MISIIDYGMGNLRSVAKAVELFTKDVQIIRDPDEIRKSSAIIIPGDGAFPAAMKNLSSGGWIEPLREHIESDGYCLGICLGFQILFSSSEEFSYNEGLDVIKGRVVRFSDSSLKVPHMGWNRVDFNSENKFLKGIDSGTYFYFIHSFYPVDVDSSSVIATADYCGRFTCVAGHGNLIASQFHPEKSHEAGLKIIKNFVEESCR